MSNKWGSGHLSVLSIKCDVSNEQHVKSAVEHIVSHFGSLDIAFNNAGIQTPQKPMHEITTEEYYTPNHTAINKVGIKPDVEVELTKDSEGNYETSIEKDAQLLKAIETVTNL